MYDKLRDDIRELFVEAGTAHRAAFAATDGEDPDWSIWYADFVLERIAALLEMPLTRSRLIYCLMFVESERQAGSPDADRASYYADHMVEHFAPSPFVAEDRLVLYYFPTCPFCRRVFAVIEDLQIDVELRNIGEDERFRDELISARGRATVPVLRITSRDGEDRWMPESLDIVDYLRRTYRRAA